MTNLESIKQGTHKAFNEFWEKTDANEMAQMISENSCKKCICRAYCDNYRWDGSCQQIIKDWLNEEEQK